jgi:hypothetical protein
MDRITAVLQYQWRAYWRRFRGSGSMRASNAGPLVLLGGLATIRYLQQLPLAATQLANGETTRYEALLGVVFLAWLVPVMGETRRSIASHDLLHFPFSASELFLIRVGSAFISPFSWIIVACSLALFYPVAMAPHPLTGILALLILVLLGLFTSLTITHLLSSAFARTLILGALLAISAAAGFLWLEKGTGALVSLVPHHLAATAAVSSTPIRALAVLAATTLVIALLALRTFSLTLQPHRNLPSGSFSIFSLIQFPGRFGGLLKKDLRYTSRLLDIYLALPIVLFFNMYLISDPFPSAIAFFVIVALLYLPCVSIALNCFGLEKPNGLDRYAVFPLSGREKLLSKNLAFGTLMIVLFVTILPLAFWKFNVRASVIGFVELLTMGLAYVSCGNWMSVKQPFRMQFYRFASGGSVVDAAMGIIFGSVPAAVTVYLVYKEDAGAFWKIGLMLLLYTAIFLFSLSRAARVLENQREEIRRSLS